MTTHKPTDEQAEIIAATANDERSLCVNADAGTGKSTTLEMAAKGLKPSSRTLALAFNKIIAEEAARRLPAHVECRTLNALGHAALGRALGGIKLDANKLRELAKADKQIHFTDRDEIVALARSAMQAGLVPHTFHVEGLRPDTFEEWRSLSEDGSPDIRIVEQARDLLIRNIKEALRGNISFDDQIYVSVFFTPQCYPKFHTLLVDEAQDLSPMNHLQLKLLRPSRLIVVGDRKQAIYAWRGASARSMDDMKALASAWLDLPLHTTFRCPKRVVARQQHHAPGYRAHESNAEGRIVLFQPPEGAVVGWEWPCVTSLREAVERTKPGATLAVLCRNNAPLVALALKLLAQRIPAQVLGRDIAQGLIALSRKIARNDAMGRSELLGKIKEWGAREAQIAEANGEESKLDAICDKCEALIAIAVSVRDAGELRKVLADMFSDGNARGVLLSSIHKAKGREWDVVLHLDPARCPSRWAKTPTAQEQERNLLYVCETRTKHTLAMANLGDFQ